MESGNEIAATLAAVLLATVAAVQLPLVFGARSGAQWRPLLDLDGGNPSRLRLLSDE